MSRGPGRERDSFWPYMRLAQAPYQAFLFVHAATDALGCVQRERVNRPTFFGQLLRDFFLLVEIVDRGKFQILQQVIFW
jgi:hypothetical protein